MHDWKSKGTNIDDLIACLQYLIDVPLDYSPVLGSDDIGGFDIFCKEFIHEKIFIDIQSVSYNECLPLSIDLISDFPLTFKYWKERVG